MNKRRETKPKPAPAHEILPEYDFRKAPPNPYAARYAARCSVVVLDPEVAAAFPDRNRGERSAPRPRRHHSQTSPGPLTSPHAGRY
jgi:hypothetical protein